MTTLGIDVSKDKLDVHLLHDDYSQDAQFDNNKSGWRSLRNWLKKRSHSESVNVCLEATGRYGEGVTEFLHKATHTVSVVNPNRIKSYAQSLLTRNKTDMSDAMIIANFCRTQWDTLPIWTPPDPAQHRLQALIRHLQDLEKMRQQERNRLKSGNQDDDIMSRLTDHVDFMDQQIIEVKDNINRHIHQHPNLKDKHDLIISIKGIGSLTAAKLLAEIPNIHDFDSPKQLVAFAGLNPRQRRSGSSIRGKTRISKIGHASIRAALYLPAVVAKNTNPLLQPFVQRLQQSGHCPMSIVVAVMRKLLHLIYGILKSKQPFDPDYLNKKTTYA